MVLEQKEMMKKAEAAFADFCKEMKERIGSEFDKKDLPIFRNVFVNGYMNALEDLVKMCSPNMN